MHWAAAVNNARAARSLLQAGADKDAQDGREQTPLFLAAREGAVEVARLLVGLGAARGLRDQAGLAPGDIARQRNHWDLLTLLEGTGPPEARHKAAPGREAGMPPRACAASGGGAAPRGRMPSSGARPRGGGAYLHARTWSLDSGARGVGVRAHGRSPSWGAGGPPSRARRFSAGSRGPRPSPAVVRGRPGRGASASEGDCPQDWVALGACGPAPGAPIPPCLTPSPERASPQVVWGLPVHREIPLTPGGGSQT